MTKENYIINKLSKLPPMVIEIAYLYAINITTYGVDVTEKWLTVTQQAYALEQAYKKGYYEGRTDGIQQKTDRLHL